MGRELGKSRLLDRLSKAAAANKRLLSAMDDGRLDGAALSMSAALAWSMHADLFEAAHDALANPQEQEQ